MRSESIIRCKLTSPFFATASSKLRRATALGRDDSTPVPPLNLIGDFGGGGMLLALGIVSALLESQNSGKGQVIDAAMTDGSSLLMTMMYSMHQSGFWNLERL